MVVETADCEDNIMEVEERALLLFLSPLLDAVLPPQL